MDGNAVVVGFFFLSEMLFLSAYVFFFIFFSPVNSSFKLWVILKIPLVVAFTQFFFFGFVLHNLNFPKVSFDSFTYTSVLHCLILSFQFVGQFSTPYWSFSVLRHVALLFFFEKCMLICICVWIVQVFERSIPLCIFISTIFDSLQSKFGAFSWNLKYLHMKNVQFSTVWNVDSRVSTLRTNERQSCILCIFVRFVALLQFFACN